MSTTNLARYQADLEALLELANDMALDIGLEGKTNKTKAETTAHSKIIGTFRKKYQRWYTEAHAVVRQLAPYRLKEFEELYLPDGKRKHIGMQTYRIQDWLNGITFRSATDLDARVITAMLFQTQEHILESVQSRFESSLHDIKQIMQAEVFDSEIDSARELKRCKFLRAAGAIVE